MIGAGQVLAAAKVLGDGLGYLFYIENPKNTEVQEISELPKYLLSAIPAMLLLAFVEAVISSARGKNLYRLHDSVMSMNLGIFQQVFGLAYRFFWIGVYIYVHNHFRVLNLSHYSWLNFFVMLLVVDLIYYWFHRLAHEFHALWAAHSVHHSGEDFNFLTALRQGALQQASSPLFNLPLALVFPPATFVAHNTLNTLGQYWIHTSLVGNLGPLELILNTPSHHRMHHRPPGNCNYAGVLIIWDRIFGTFVAEDDHVDYYGLAQQYSTFDPVWANFEHWKRMWVNVRHNGVLDLLFKRRAHHKLVFHPTAAFTAMPKPPANSWSIPETPRRTKMIGDASAQSGLAMAYVILLFVEHLLGYLAITVLGGGWTKLETLTYCLLLTLGLSSIGRLSDSIWTGWALEFLRHILWFALIYTSPFPSVSTHSGDLFQVWAATAGLWVVVCGVVMAVHPKSSVVAPTAVSDTAPAADKAKHT